MAQRKGSRLRAAQLTDPRYLAEVEQQAERSTPEPESRRPGWEDFDHVVETLYLLSDDIRTLIAVQTKTEVAFRRRPAGPLDIIAERKSQINMARVRELTGEE